MASKAAEKEPKSLFVATLADVNRLINNMESKTGDLSGPYYHNLVEEWRKMRFTHIFSRPNEEEILEFAPVTFLATKVNLLPPTETKRRVYGLLVLYGLYMKQPCEKICQIRVTHSEWQHFLDLFRYCAENGYKEQCFVFEKLWSLNAFDFVFSPVDLSFLISHRKRMEDLGVVAMEAIMPESDAVISPTDPSLLPKQIDLSKILEAQSKYNEMAGGISGIEMSNLTEKLQGILSRVPKKWPKYTAFVNANRRKEAGEESVQEIRDIGVRRRNLIDRPVAPEEDPEPITVSADAPKAYKLKVDPNYSFVYTHNSRRQADWMRRKKKTLEGMEAAEKEGDEQASERLYEPMEIEMEDMEVSSEEVDRNKETELQQKESEPVPSENSDDVLSRALSMPVVQWNDSE